MSKPAVLVEPEFVGREKELQELQTCLNSVIEGKGRTVFVSGEAGTGKTRLTREFLNSASRQGVAVMAGWCLSDAAAPYFPFVEAFNSYYCSAEKEVDESLSEPGKPPSSTDPFQMTSRDRGITAWLSGAEPIPRAGKPAIVSPQVWKDQVFAGVAKTLHIIAAQTPIILFIEDVHWADSASLALLYYVARAINNSERILLLATFRSEELTADAEGNPHPLVETLRLMRREDLYKEIGLSNFGQKTVSEIAENMIGGSIQEAFAESLARRSRGNALFVVESLRMLAERGGFVQENEQWRLAVDKLSIPDKVRDIILQRLSVLKHSQRRVLSAASVIGEKFSTELLSTVLGQDSLDVLETLDAIAQSTSLVRVDEGFYRFDHAVSRETLYEELSPPLKKGYHARIAEKLESSELEALPLSDLAFHYARAGNEEKAVKFALLAGNDALARWSNAEAIKQFSYVLKSVVDSKQFEERMRALEGLGDAFYANNMFNDATRIFLELANSNVIEVVRLRAFRKAMEAVFQYGDSPYLTELVKKAEPYAAADRLENARVLMSRGRSIGMAGMLLAALNDWEAALQVFEEEYSLWDVAWALIAIGINHAQFAVTGIAAKHGLAESLRSIALFEDIGDSRWQMEACYVAGIALTNCLLGSEALKILARVIEIDKKMNMGDYLRLAHANVWSAWCLEALGDFENGLSFGLKALEFSEKTDSPVARGMVYSNLTVLYSLLGDMKRSEEFFEKLMKLPPEILNNINIQPEFSKLVSFAFKSQWKELDKFFEETLEQFKPSPKFLPLEATLKLKRLYAWALERQGRFEEAKILREENERANREAAERYAHANVQASLMVRRKVMVGEEFEIRFDLVNVGRNPALLVEVKNALVHDFEVVSSPSWCSVAGSGVSMGNNEIGAFQVKTMKFSLKGLKCGTFALNPQVVYIDDLGETKICEPEAVTITVQPAKPSFEVLPRRLTTGTVDLDRLLLGGIPAGYAVALVSPSFDERHILVERYVEVGAENNGVSFFLTVDSANAEVLAEKYPSNIVAFVCSPRADLMRDLPNVAKLNGVESLTEIDISQERAFRRVGSTHAGSLRACIEIVSDVLLQHHALATRKWLSGLITSLKSKGFTTMAVIDPLISPDEVPAIVSLFDGEIRIAEKENEKGRKKVLQVIRLCNQQYAEDEVVLTKETL